jgi:hypothetical protein
MPEDDKYDVLEKIGACIERRTDDGLAGGRAVWLSGCLKAGMTC